jgi:hypothetical protein
MNDGTCKTERKVTLYLLSSIRSSHEYLSFLALACGNEEIKTYI